MNGDGWLRGKVAVVTGAASGIGRAIARRFADEGATVVVSDIRETPLDGGPTTMELISDLGGSAEFVAADVSNWDDVTGLFDRLAADYDRLDIVVNNAAVFNAKGILETTLEDWDAIMSVNLRGLFMCCKRAIELMQPQEAISEVRGRIINLASQHGLVGSPNSFAYSVSKGGVLNLTRQLAVDFGRQGILVNAIAPGRILTGVHASDDPSHPSVTYARSRTPFHRLGRAEDVASAAVFLASDDATFISGAHLMVDGGWMAY